MYIWQLAPVLSAELGIKRFVEKARLLGFSSLWIKVADGNQRYRNITGAMAKTFADTRKALRAAKIDVWGWHVPNCKGQDAANAEARLLATIADTFDLDGLLVDAEAGAHFFAGNASDAELYAASLADALGSEDRGLALSSHDIVSGHPGFPFDAFANHIQTNAPQVSYGASSSVQSRLYKAISENQQFERPFLPVGAGWVGMDDGGCASASACAERAREFIRLTKQYKLPGYSFWHWMGAPTKLWEVLATIAP
jgi:hypothetical protein